MKISGKIALVTFAIIFLDLGSKFLVQFLNPDAISLNSGFIFGFGQIPASYWSIIVFIFAVSGLGIFFTKTLNLEKINNWLGVSFLLGGAISNLIDRVVDYKVIDFISVPAITKFNLADVCIVLGVILLIVEQFTSRRANRDEVAEKSGLRD